MGSTSDHIPFDQLVDLAEGRVTAEERATVQAHVDTCVQCADDIAWLERVIDLMRSDDSVEPPPCVVAGVVDLFRSQTISAAPDRPRLIRAVLRFDSARLAAPIGRRAGPTGERQLLFSAEQFHLDLRMIPADGLVAVAGQVLGASVGGQVELHSAEVSVHAMLNDMSEFVLPAIPPGVYSLNLRIDDLEVEIAGLTLEA